MQKISIIVLLILYCAGSALCGEFGDFLKKAEQGDVDAQYNIGVIYDNGQGVPQDYKQAAKWYTKAAKQGHAFAQYNLALMHVDGQGVPQDHKQAAKWFTKAAEQGDAKAQYNIGVIYYKGQGVPQDYKQAVKWFTKAAEQGYIDAQRDLGWIYRTGPGFTDANSKSYIVPDFNKSEYWSLKAAEKNDTSAQLNLGIIYFDGGANLNKDFKKATYWFKKAAEKGDKFAQYKLGLMYYEGEGVFQDFKLAYVWESLAAAQGDKDAISNRDLIAKKLSPQQLGEAQEFATKIQYKIDHPSKSQEQSKTSQAQKKVNGSGTGFFITKDGYVLTCHHVIKDADQIKILAGGNTYLAKVVRDDPNNDLALLKIKGSFPAIAFSSKRSAKMGQEVFTIGYPNPSLQGISAKFTKGTINSLTGFQDDLRLYQISIPVQPGNSGGALLDENGNIIGVIMAMLNAKTTFKISGSLPQNVNYAVKSIYAQAMLDTIPEIGDKLLDPSRSKSNAIDRVKKSTVVVLSYQ